MGKKEIEQIGNNHLSMGLETPLRLDAFAKDDDEKIRTIQYHFEKIMETLGLDLSDDSLSGTPYRVAKMYIKELFYGLDPKNKPSLSVFENKYGYKRMLVEQNITINSFCEHHFLPITGFAHIAYIPCDKVIGLSKINRIVDYYAHRPQVQERLSRQVLVELQNTLGSKDVMVVICAKHLCVSSRGIKDKSSLTTMIDYGGRFEEQHFRDEFFTIVGAQLRE